MTSTKLIAALATTAALGIASLSAAQTDCEPQWLPTFGAAPGFPAGQVKSIVTFDDGSGPALFVGGLIKAVGGMPVNAIARWDGESWSALADEPFSPSGYIDALVPFDHGGGPVLYAVGKDNLGSGTLFASWDGQSWTNHADAIAGSVSMISALAVFDDGTGPALFVGGKFYYNDAYYFVAKWDGTVWQPLDPGPAEHGVVLAFAVLETPDNGAELYAGGTFSGMASVGKWNGRTWSSVGPNQDFGIVQSLAAFDDGSGPALYATGFSKSESGLGRWNGNAWSSVPGWTGMKAFSLLAMDGSLLVGGSAWPGDSMLHKWDGETWTSLDAVSTSGSSSIRALGRYDSGDESRIVAGGVFTSINGVQVNHIATWDGSQWEAMGTSESWLGSSVRALKTFDDGEGSGPALFVGGGFANIGQDPFNYIARWDLDSATWSSLGGGLDSAVLALEEFDDGSGPALYAGAFNPAGGSAVNHIAKWGGHQKGWIPVGNGTNGTVHALAVFDDGAGPALYAGGSFTAAGAGAAYNIARWNGSNWSTVGGLGVANTVHALTTWDDGTGPALYAGGSFSKVGSVTAKGVARWDGTSWSSLDGGLGSTVRALVAGDDGYLYAGGNFANSVAKWDGSVWSSVGGGPGQPVHALALFDIGNGVDLYADHMKWDGNEWTPTGLPWNVRAIAGFNDDKGPPRLYFGGEFAASPAGDSYLAMLQGCPPPKPVPGDLTGDGKVGVADLLVLLAAWGPCDECPAPAGTCPADLDGDCAVGLDDLLILLANWG